jgi:uncharacterized RDD family membrane protein YckC
VTIEDRYITATPEGISLEFVLAGLGSRFAAYLLDLVIQVVFIAASAVAIGLATGSHPTETGRLVDDGFVSLLSALALIGYFVVCDLLFEGRSIGKRAAGIRVVRSGGGPIGFWSSLVRNILRLVDGIPFPLYLVGSVLILATTRRQRLGDLAADTVVVRVRRAADRQLGVPPWTSPEQWSGAVAPGYGQIPGPGWLPPHLAHWDVSGVSDQDLSVARLFLANRFGYTPEARARLALRIAFQLWPSVAGAPPNLHPEQFIEAVVAVKSARG